MPYKNPADKRASDKRYHERNREKRNAYGKTYRTTHKSSLMVSGRHKVRHYEKLEMAEQQKWKCAICGDHIDELSKFDVDHDHLTKQVRQLLCGPCNRLIGHARENSTIMHHAIHYLAKHNGYHDELDVFIEDVS